MPLMLSESAWDFKIWIFPRGTCLRFSLEGLRAEVAMYPECACSWVHANNIGTYNKFAILGRQNCMRSVWVRSLRCSKKASQTSKSGNNSRGACPRTSLDKLCAFGAWDVRRTCILLGLRQQHTQRIWDFWEAELCGLEAQRASETSKCQNFPGSNNCYS